MEAHKIIVAYDFQELSDAALKQAYDLAKFINSGILLVLVLNDDLLIMSDVSKNAHSDRIKKKITDAMQREITVHLKEVADKASSESGVPVDFCIETGKIYERILDIAKKNKARFIVMGRTSKESGKGRFGSARDGSARMPCRLSEKRHAQSLRYLRLNVVLPSKTLYYR